MRHIIHALTSNDRDEMGVVDQPLFEMLSLTLEYLRSFSVHSQVESSLQPHVKTGSGCGNIQQGPLVRMLEILCQCVDSSKCVLSLAKLLSVVYRLTKSLNLDKETFIQLKDTFCYLAVLEMMCSSLKRWFRKEGSVALQLAMKMCGREHECVEGCCTSMQDNVHGTVVRRYFLLAFRLWSASASLLKEGTFLLPLIV